MNGLPEDFDASGFVGQAVEQVSFSANTIYLSFEEDYTITVESSYEHEVVRGSSEPVRSTVPVVESRLMKLIGQSVTVATVERPGTLVLEFEDGQIFRCFDDSPMYESYHINCDGREIIV